jgi:hypothetical protein
MAKITKATFKSFIKKNRENLFVRMDSKFDGMYDSVEYIKGACFREAVESKTFKNYEEHTLGFEGIYLVGESRDYFRPYNDEEYTGIEWMNCCGSGVIAVKK